MEEYLVISADLANLIYWLNHSNLIVHIPGIACYNDAADAVDAGGTDGVQHVHGTTNILLKVNTLYCVTCVEGCRGV